MSNYETKMRQLGNLQRLGFLSNLESGLSTHLFVKYQKANDEDKKALDDNAETIFNTYFNDDNNQNIKKNVFTMTIIMVVYAALSLLSVLLIVFGFLKIAL